MIGLQLQLIKEAAVIPNEGWTDPGCPVARTIDLVGDRWSLLIIRDAMEGAVSFTALRDGLGIARNTLTDRLRKLVDHGVLTTRTAPGGKRHSYELTAAGLELFTTVVALRQWGERHTFAPGESRSTLLDDTGRVVPKVRVTNGRGGAVTATTSRVRRPR